MSEGAHSINEEEVQKFATELKAKIIKISTMEGNEMIKLDELFEQFLKVLLNDGQSKQLNQETVEKQKSKCCGCCKCFH